MRQKTVDAMACAFGGIDSETARSARRAITRLAPRGSASVLGGGSSSADLAGFANGVAVRYLDLSDVYIGPREVIHPSDCVAAVLAVAEAEHRSGADALCALATAYEVLCRLADTVDLTSRGWDGVSLCAIATAAAAARLLGLDQDGVMRSINIAASDAPALLQTRVGQLSMWKAAAGPNSARQGVLAAYLAAEGMTGPPAVFEGKHGLRKMLHEDLDWPDDAEWRILRVRLKRYPAMYFVHTAIEAALDIRARGFDPRTIDRIVVSTFRRVGDERFTPDKWAPETRETADHSLPYCTAVALLDGALGAPQFSDARLRGADVRALMEKTEIVEDRSFSALLPDAMPCRVVVHLRHGDRVVAERLIPPGHPDRPLTDDDVQVKLVDLAGDRWPRSTVLRLAERLWSIDRIDDVVGLLALPESS